MTTAVQDTSPSNLDLYNPNTNKFDGEIPVSLNALQDLTFTPTPLNVRGFLFDNGTTDYIDSISTAAKVLGTEEYVRISVFAGAKNGASFPDSPLGTDGYYLSIGKMNVEGARSLGLVYIRMGDTFETTETEKEIPDPKAQKNEVARRLAKEIMEAVGKSITEKGLNLWQEVAKSESEKRGMPFQVIDKSK